MNDALWTCVWTPQLWLGLKPCLQMSRVHNHGWWFYTKDYAIFWHIWVRCNNKRSGRWDPGIPISMVLNNAVLRRSWERPNGTCPQRTRTFSGSKNKRETVVSHLFLYPVPELYTLSDHWKKTNPSDSYCVYSCHVLSCWDCADGNRTHSLRTDVWVTWVTVLQNSRSYYCRARPSQHRSSGRWRSEWSGRSQRTERWTSSWGRVQGFRWRVGAVVRENANVMSSSPGTNFQAHLEDDEWSIQKFILIESSSKRTAESPGRCQLIRTVIRKKQLGSTSSYSHISQAMDAAD